MRKSQNWLQVNSGLGLGIVGFGLAILGTRRITEGGIYADAHGTSGSISLGLMILTMVGLVLAAISIVVLVRSLNNVLQETNATQKQIRNLTLWSLIFSLASTLFYIFAVFAIIFGCSAVKVSYRKDAENTRRPVRYACILAIIAAIASTVSVLTTV